MDGIPRHTTMRKRDLGQAHAAANRALVALSAAAEFLARAEDVAELHWLAQWTAEQAGRLALYTVDSRSGSPEALASPRIANFQTLALVVEAAMSHLETAAECLGRAEKEQAAAVAEASARLVEILLDPLAEVARRETTCGDSSGKHPRPDME